MIERKQSHLLKEIYEQPDALRRVLASRDEVDDAHSLVARCECIIDQLPHVSNIILVGSGTSYHAALYGKYVLEDLCDLVVRVEVASEFAHEKLHEPPDHTLIIVISQSGETADALGVARMVRERGYSCLAIINEPTSSLGHIADFTLAFDVGIERAIPATKSFSGELAMLVALASVHASMRGDKQRALQVIHDLRSLPDTIETWLPTIERDVERIAGELYDRGDVTFLGERFAYPIASEGALKLSEAALVPARAYPLGEFRHGPLALVDDRYSALVIAPYPTVHAELATVVRLLHEQGAWVASIQPRGPRYLYKHALYLPARIPEMLSGFVSVVPLQLLAAHCAAFSGVDPDHPRHLHKVVS